ncbi:hypothetical protein M885DRAFT_509438 [Pelagophyceae sp. CCMP2097]|nr:hypothetical protein M885DRAFT_509438 [Pelagophyceae sp. CCMP2097]
MAVHQGPIHLGPIHLGGFALAAEVLIETILSWLTGPDLGLFSCASRQCRDVHVNEHVWESVVRRRWFVPSWTARKHDVDMMEPATLRPKMLGASSWARAYRELERRLNPPRTWMTPSHAKIVAKGRSGHCAAWATVNHARDCRTFRDAGGESQCIEVRLIVQNVATPTIRFDPRQTDVMWLCCHGGSETPLATRARIDGVSPVFAHSEMGHVSEAAPPGEIALRQFEWAAFSIFVACPECAFEADFLERALSLTVRFSDGGGGEQDVVAPFAPPDQIDKWYSMLPGGWVMLER